MSWLESVRSQGVYPRVCGGTAKSSGPTKMRRGLSPRVRGNLIQTVALCQRQRSIPACAGEPRRRGFWLHPRKVYPRVCGGTCRDGGDDIESQGLSPRVRGNLLSDIHMCAAEGSIPACAGEPFPLPRRRHSREVYPRVCGGTVNMRAMLISVSGLSPRVRGNRPTTRRSKRCSRSIPACAGEPACTLWRMIKARVYPRVCGGTSLSRRGIGCPTGLSPRVRGNQLQYQPPVVRRRSIPACAGEPAA